MVERMPPTTGDDLVEQYREAFARHGDSPAAVLWPRGRQDLRFEALTRHIDVEGFSILDYGCGLGHLKPYLDRRFGRYEYRGADRVPEFVRAVSAKFPEAHVTCVRSHAELGDIVDHIVISGAFNIIEGSDREGYLKLVHSALIHLFGLARVSLAVNFMTDRVDFMQARAMHMNVGEIAAFARQCLSPRILVDESYLPYEFTLVIFKDREIIRPDNVYRPRSCASRP